MIIRMRILVKYRSQMTVPSNNDNLNYLTDPKFTNVNRLFVLSFSRTNQGDNKDSFSHHYVPQALKLKTLTF